MREVTKGGPRIFVFAKRGTNSRSLKKKISKSTKKDREPTKEGYVYN